MLDYFGSIMKSEEDIDTELIQYFNRYNENHILKIINDLRQIGTLTTNNSISGWNIFVRNYIINEIKLILDKETLLAQQRLEFMKFCDSFQFNPDISRKISEEINPEIIIPKDEL